MDVDSQILTSLVRSLQVFRALIRLSVLLFVPQGPSGKRPTTRLARVDNRPSHFLSTVHCVSVLRIRHLHMLN